MKKYLCTFVAFFLLVSTPAMAKSLGVGAVIGSPTGLSFNVLMNDAQSLHTILAWDLDDDEEELILASHYTWRRKDFSEKNLGWFYGAGGRLQILDKDDPKNRDHDDFELGPSATTGLFYEYQQVEFFLKGNLTLNLIEETDAEVDAMVGAHFNF